MIRPVHIRALLHLCCTGIPAVLAFLCLVSSAFSQEQKTQVLFYEALTIPLDVAVEDSAVKLSSFTFASNYQQISMGGLTLTNTENTSITDAVIAADLLAEDGSRLLSMPFFFHDETANGRTANLPFGETSWMPPGFAERSRDYVKRSGSSHALEPGDSWLISGVNNLLLRRCPMKARITLIALHYATGAVSVHANPEFHLDPAVNRIPPASQLLRFSAHESSLVPGTDVLLKLRITAQGCPLVESDHAGSNEIVWIQHLVSQLKFVPAVNHASAVNEEVPLLIHYSAESRFNDKWETSKLPVSLLILNLMPLKYDPMSAKLPEDERPKDVVMVYLNQRTISANPPNPECSQ